MKQSILRPCRAAALSVLLASSLAAVAAPPPSPADEKTANAFSSVFVRLFTFESERAPRENEASERGDLAAVAAIYDGREAFLRQLAGTDGLPAPAVAALRSVADVRSIQAAALRGLGAAIQAEGESAVERWTPTLEATDTLAVHAVVRLLVSARSAGAGDTAATASVFFPDCIRILLGDEPMPVVKIDDIVDPALRSRALRIRSAMPAPPPQPPRHVVRGTPEARAVSAAIAALAKAETDLVEKYKRPHALGDAGRAAGLIEAQISELRKIPVAGCPAGFRKAFGDYGRSRVGIAKTMRDLDALGDSPAEQAQQAALFSNLGERNARQIADKAALMREARAAGADTEPLFDLWVDAFAHMALAPSPAGRPAARALAKGSPAQLHADALAALEADFQAAAERAPNAAAGAKARFAAFRAFYAGAKALDVSALPKDVARAHTTFLAAFRDVGRALQRLADAGDKGPAAFLAAIQSQQSELETLQKNAATAAKQLKAALRRAGADVSALDLEIAD